MKCRTCGKELIGKEKLLCRSCREKGKDIVIKTGKGIGYTALFVLAANTLKNKITGFFKDGANDI